MNIRVFFDNIAARFSTPLGAVLSIVDLLLTVALFMAVVLFLVRNHAKGLIKYMLVLVLVSVLVIGLSQYMPVSNLLFRDFVLLAILAVFALFPQPIKRMLWRALGPKHAAMQYHTQYDVPDEVLAATVDDIVRAVQNLSKKDIGALIIIAPDNLPEHILDSGTRLNADLSGALLESLFHTKAPLHDGAVYVHGNKVLAAGCFLPLTQRTNLDKELGTRHRAAIGLTEQFNHLAIIVSEETGIISVARHGELERYLDTQGLSDLLKQIYGLKASDEKSNKRRRSIK